MKPADPLANLQQWMRVVLEHRGGAAAGTEQAAREGLGELEALIEPSARMSALERIGVYARMYKERLVEALGMDYDGLERLLGRERFQELALAFVHRHPSHVRSLNDYGREMPGFVAEQVATGALPPFATCLARFECALQEVLVEPDVAPEQDASAYAALGADPAGHRLRTVAAIRILELEHPAHRFLEDRERREPYSAAPTKLLVHRLQERAAWTELSLPAFAVFTALHEGRTFQAALEEALESTTEDPETLLANVGRWFADWRGRGLFAAVERLP